MIVAVGQIVRFMFVPDSQISKRSQIIDWLSDLDRMPDSEICPRSQILAVMSDLCVQPDCQILDPSQIHSVSSLSACPLYTTCLPDSQIESGLARLSDSDSTALLSRFARPGSPGTWVRDLEPDSQRSQILMGVGFKICQIVRFTRAAR